MDRVVTRRRGARLAVVAVLVATAAGCSAADGESAVPVGPPASGTVVTAPSTTATVATTAPPTAPELPPPAAPITGTDDPRVFVLGDSVILGAEREVVGALAGREVTIDATESRLVDQGLTVLRARKAASEEEAATAHETAVALAELSGQPAPAPPEPLTYRELLGPVVVVSLCTNYSAGNGFRTFVDRYMDELSSVDRVVWVTCGEWSAGQVEANAAVRDAAAAAGPGGARRLEIADWAPHGAWAPYTYDDGIHVNELGREVMGEVVARAVGPLVGS